MTWAHWDFYNLPASSKRRPEGIAIKVLPKGALPLSASTNAACLAVRGPAAKLVLLPNANHFFKVVKSADVAANAASYSKPVPLAPHIANEIADLTARNSLPRFAWLCDVVVNADSHPGL